MGKIIAYLFGKKKYHYHVVYFYNHGYGSTTILSEKIKNTNDLLHIQEYISKKHNDGRPIIIISYTQFKKKV